MLFQLIDGVKRVVGRPSCIDGCLHQLGLHLLFELLIERLACLLHCQNSGGMTVSQGTDNHLILAVRFWHEPIKAKAGEGFHVSVSVLLLILSIS